MLVDKWRPSARRGDVAACIDLLSRELRTAHEIPDAKIRKKNAKKVMDVLNFFLSSERRLLAKQHIEKMEAVPIQCLQELFRAALPIVEGETHSNAKNRTYGVEDGLKPAARLCGLLVACVNLSPESEEQAGALASMLDGVKSKIDKLAKGGKDQLIPAMRAFCAGCSWLAKLCYSNCVRFHTTPPPFKGDLLEIHLWCVTPLGS